MPKFYCVTNDAEVYQGYEEKIIREIMKHHMCDRGDARYRLYNATEDSPVTLDNLESCWTEWDI